MSTESQGRSWGGIVSSVPTSYRRRHRESARRSTLAVAKVAGVASAALAFLACGGAPSYAAPVTDAFGNTCDTSELIANPNPPPDSICPASLNQAKRKSVLPPPKLGPPDVNPIFDYNHPFIYGMWAGMGHWGTGGMGDPPRLGGPITFSLFGSDNASGVYAGVGTSSTWNSGYRVTDTAGAIPPNSLAPGFRALSTQAGANLTADGTRLFDLNGNQKLLFGVTFEYRRSEMDFGTSALTPGVTSAGSVRRDTYSIKGSADYLLDTIYFSGRAAVEWSHVDITNNVVQGRGDTNGRGFAVSGTVGKLFTLLNSTGVQPTMLVKAPPSRAGGYAVFLDLNGRLGYRNVRDDGFTDSSGFIYGTEQLSYWTLGARANLVAVIPSALGRFSWMPYVGLTFDQQLGFRHTWDLPSASDTLDFSQGQTWWGVQGGLSMLDRGGVKAGVNAYYRASSDTSVLGGNLFLKVPFFADAVIPAKESGIRVLSK
jgi:hypothetical protein